jgi:hypothetical protein
VVACDVEELTGHALHATPESVDEGGARRPILKCRDGVVVDRAGELGAALGEASYVLTETLPGCCLQLRSSHCLPGRMYVPWKLLTKTRHKSVQSLILPRGKCSSHVHAESPR